MFNISNELMDLVKQSIIPQPIPAYANMAHSATCSTCRGTCKGICSERCSLGCKNGCTRASGR